MSFLKAKTTHDFASNNMMMLFEINVVKLVEDDLYRELRKTLHDIVAAPDMKQRILEEVEKMLAKAETKEILTRMISEVVSETIKTTLLELKQQGVI